MEIMRQILHNDGYALCAHKAYPISNGMKDEIKILAGAALLVGIVAGVLVLRGGDGPNFSSDTIDTFESIRLTSDISPIALTEEERQALVGQNMNFPNGEDPQATSLLRVQNADDLSAIDQDLAQSNLSGLATELDDIDSDLQGL